MLVTYRPSEEEQPIQPLCNQEYELSIKCLADGQFSSSLSPPLSTDIVGQCNDHSRVVVYRNSHRMLIQTNYTKSRLSIALTQSGSHDYEVIDFSLAYSTVKLEI